MSLPPPPGPPPDDARDRRGSPYPMTAGIPAIPSAHGALPARQDRGLPYADSKLELYYYFPTERSWTLLGDRTVICLVGHPERKVRGTLKSSRR